MDPKQSYDELAWTVISFEASNWQKAKSMFIQARGDKDDRSKLDQFLQGWASVQDAKDMCISTKNQASKEYAPMLGSILGKIDMATQVGDLAMKAAPESVGLAWMGVKLCLHCVMDDFATCQLFGVVCSDIVGILISCACYGRMFGTPKGPESFQELHSTIADRVPEIYCNILEISFAVKKYMSHNKLVRTGKNVLRSANEKFKDKIQALHENETKMRELAHTASEQMQEYYATKMLQNQAQSSDAQEATLQALKDVKVQLSSYQQMRKVDETAIAELLETLKTINRKTPLVVAKEQCQAYQRQLRMDAIQSDILQRKEKDRKPKETCSWIFKNADYEKWRDTATNSVLWISGPGGCGKSILVSAIINALQAEVKEGGNILHYFYCDAGDESSKKTEKILRHLLSQLLDKAENTDSVAKIDEANRVIEKFLRRKPGTRQSEEATSKETISFVEAYRGIARILDRPKVYLIMDALDECIDLEKEGLLRSLKDVIKSETSTVNLKIIICSRPEPEIEKELGEFPNVEVERNNGPDIEKNVEAELSDLSGWTEEERRFACKEVTRKAGSYFRCVALLIQLLKQPWQRPLSNRLSELPEGLNNNYQEIFQKTDPAYVKLLEICITWITLAEDEIKVGEIMDIYSRTFMELEDIPNVPENDGPHQIDQIRTAGSSFLRVIPDTKTIKLRHYTVKEFFLGIRKIPKEELVRTQTFHDASILPKTEQPFVISEKDGHVKIAISILDHLLSKLFRETHMKSYLPTAEKSNDDHEVPAEASGTSTVGDQESHAIVDTRSSLEEQGCDQDPGHGSLPTTKPDANGTSLSKETGVRATELGGETPQPSNSELNGHSGGLNEAALSEAKLVEDETKADVAVPVLDFDSDFDSYDSDGEQHYKGMIDDSSDEKHFTRYEPQYLMYHLQKVEELRGTSGYEDNLGKELMEKLDTFMQPESEAFLTWVNYLVTANGPFLESERGTIMPIHIACAYGLLGLFYHLIERGDDMHKITTEDWIALHFASWCRNFNVSIAARKLEMIKTLVQAEQSPNFMQGDCLSPFQILLAWDAPTPIHRAWCKFNFDTLKLVLDGVDNVNIRDQSGETPLHLLMYESKINLEFLHALLERGADVNAEDDHSKMPLAIAASCGQAEAVKILIEAGAVIDDDDLDGMTALHFAALNGRSASVKTLLDGNADPSRTDSKGNTALHHAFKNGDLATCETLVNWCNNSNPTLLKKINKKGDTPIRKAAAKGHRDVIEFLLNATRDVGINEVDVPMGYTPLHAAARNGYSGIVDRLIEHEANTSIKDRVDKTALQVAIWSWHEDDKEGEYEAIVLSLMQEEPEIASQDHALLHGAASKGSLAILTRLHELKADFDMQDEEGWTALEFARQYRQESTIRFLEEKRSSVGKPPSRWATINANYLLVSDDGLEIRYLNVSDEIAASTLTDHPLQAGIKCYYFEVELHRLHGKMEFHAIVVGLARKRTETKLFRWLPGRRRGGPLSWGYHGDGGIGCSADDGLGWPADEAREYQSGDTVGCGFELDKNAIFFTRNGVRLMDAAFKNVTGRLYPVVGMMESMTLKTNFGASEFKWKPGNLRDFGRETVSGEAGANSGE